MTTPERVEMLPGRSSAQLDRMLFGPLMVAMLSLLPFVSGRVLESTFDLRIQPALFVVAGVAVVCCGIPAVILVVLQRRRLKEEEATGYTLFRWRRQVLPQVDPRTGIVLRAAGEPDLSVRVYRRRLAAARASHRPSRVLPRPARRASR